MCRTCRLVYTADEKCCHNCGCVLAYTPHTGVRWIRCSKCGHTYAYRPRRGVKWVECSKCGHPSLIGRAGVIWLSLRQKLKLILLTIESTALYFGVGFFMRW